MKKVSAGTEATTSTGIRLRRIDTGTFLMENDRRLPDALLSPTCFRHGDYDERPVHRVTITKPFYLAECQVTNSQYEMFDPAHWELRGKLGFSRDDDEAVVFVSWHDAVSSGDELPPRVAKNQRRTWFPDRWRTTGDNVVPLHVGRAIPNAWGLCDLHGNGEEWCLGLVRPLSRPRRERPGPPGGDFRVTRGGSHSTETYYLRSSNRAGVLPEERNWLIGFRVVCADYPDPPRPVRRVRVELHGNNVLQTTEPQAPAQTRRRSSKGRSATCTSRPAPTAPGSACTITIRRSANVPTATCWPSGTAVSRSQAGN